MKPYQAPASALLMIDVHVYDPSNHVFLAGFNLPKQTVFRRTINPQRSNGHPPWSQLPDEVGTGQLLTLAVRRTLESEMRRLADTPFDALGIDTWVLNRTTDGRGRLASWFENQGRGYRVWIHRVPDSYEGQRLGSLWYSAYEYARSHRCFNARHEAAAPEALGQGARVLEETLVAYRGGPGAVASFFGTLGHPYRHIRHDQATP